MGQRFRSIPSQSIELRRPRSASCETALLRKGVWQTGSRPIQLQLLTDGLTHDLHGKVHLVGKLTLLDLDMLSWLTQQYRRRKPENGWLRITRSGAGEALYRRKPHAEERRLIGESLVRLGQCQLYIEGLDVESGEEREDTASMVHLIDELTDRAIILEANTPAKRASLLRGNSFGILLGRWLRDRIDQGRVTWLDWSVQRKLEGLAKRLWVYLEAERLIRDGGVPVGLPSDSGVCTIDLPKDPAGKAWVTLGLANNTPTKRRRQLLKEGAARIMAADLSWARIEIVKHPSWKGVYQLVAWRVTEQGRRELEEAERRRRALEREHQEAEAGVAAAFGLTVEELRERKQAARSPLTASLRSAGSQNGAERGLAAYPGHVDVTDRASVGRRNG